MKKIEMDKLEFEVFCGLIFGEAIAWKLDQISGTKFTENIKTHMKEIIVVNEQ